MRQKKFLGGIIGSVATSIIGGVAKKAIGGGKGGGSSAQQPQAQPQDNTFENFMAMQIDERSRREQVQGMAYQTRGANQQIAQILQRELQNAYRDPQAAAQRIFGDYT